MAKFRGNALVVLWEIGGGTYTVTGSQMELDISRTGEAIDVTAGNASAHQRIGGLSDANAKLTLYDTLQATPAGTALWVQLGLTQKGTLSWGPNGTTAGQPKYRVVAVVTKNDSKYPMDKAVTRELGWDMDDVFLSDGDAGAVW